MFDSVQRIIRLVPNHTSFLENVVAIGGVVVARLFVQILDNCG